jgi:hypothetical protein
LSEDIAKAARGNAAENARSKPQIIIPKLQDTYSTFNESTPTRPQPAVDVVEASGNLDAGKANAQLALALNTILNGGNYEIQRTPNTFRAVGLGAGGSGTPVWTPTANTRFRLMGGIVTIGVGAQTSPNPTTLYLYDGQTIGTALILALSINVVAVAYTFTQPYYIPFYFHGNGWLSQAVNNPLIFTTSQVWQIGPVDISVWGTEE